MSNEITMSAAEYRDHESDLRHLDVRDEEWTEVGNAETRAAEARLGLTDERREEIAREVRAKHEAKWEEECAERVIGLTDGIEGTLADGGHIWIRDPNEQANVRDTVEREAEAFPANSEEFRDRVYDRVVDHIESRVGGDPSPEAVAAHRASVAPIHA